MANVLAHLSSILIPAVIFFIIGYGWIHKCNLYDDFINGAADGLKTVVGIVPTLIGLMMAVGILRGSGLLDLPGKLLQKYAAGSSISGMFPEFFPLIFIRLFSSSAATGLVLDIFKTYGTDSLAGRITSILMSCTETCFYTMSVYFMTARVTKTRYTLTGALVATFAGAIGVFYRRRCRYERAAGIPDVNFHKNSGQLRIERCMTARLQNILLFSIQMLYQQSISDPSPCKKPLPQTY